MTCPARARGAPLLLLLPLGMLAAACAGPGDEGADGGDTTAAATVDAATADTATADTPARTDSYYVHLVPGTDPAEVARRHGLEPIRVIREPRPGLHVRITPAQRAALLADSAVLDLAREIHGGEGSDSSPRLRGIGGPPEPAGAI